MSFRVNVGAALLLAVAIGAVVAQDRFGDEHGGRLKGFTKSPTEHIMNEFDGLPEVRTVHGRIADSSGAGLPEAVFEIRIENPDAKVRGVVTKPDGRFEMRSVPEGIYVFKVTRNGFQSVFGRLKVTRKAPSANLLSFELQVGV